MFVVLLMMVIVVIVYIGYSKSESEVAATSSSVNRHEYDSLGANTFGDELDKTNMELLMEDDDIREGCMEDFRYVTTYWQFSIILPICSCYILFTHSHKYA